MVRRDRDSQRTLGKSLDRRHFRYLRKLVGLFRPVFLSDGHLGIIAGSGVIFLICYLLGIVEPNAADTFSQYAGQIDTAYAGKDCGRSGYGQKSRCKLSLHAYLTATLNDISLIFTI